MHVPGCPTGFLSFFYLFFFTPLDSLQNERNILRAGFVSLGILWSYYLPVLPSSPASSDLKRAKWALIVAVLNGKIKIQHERLFEEGEVQ